MNYIQWNRAILNSKSKTFQSNKQTKIHIKQSFKYKKLMNKKTHHSNITINNNCMSSFLQESIPQSPVQHKLFKNSVLKKRFTSLCSQRNHQVIKNRIKKEQYCQISIQKYLNTILEKRNHSGITINRSLTNDQSKNVSLNNQPIFHLFLSQSNTQNDQNQLKSKKTGTLLHQKQHRYVKFKTQGKRQRQSLNNTKKASNLINQYESLSKIMVKRRNYQQQNVRCLTITPLDQTIRDTNERSSMLKNEERHIKHCKQSNVRNKMVRGISLYKNVYEHQKPHEFKQQLQQTIIQPWFSQFKSL